MVFNLIDSNDRITKEELAVRINKSEKLFKELSQNLYHIILSNELDQIKQDIGK